jgi:hypothetical protein
MQVATFLRQHLLACPIALEQFRYTTDELAGQSVLTLNSAGTTCAVGLSAKGHKPRWLLPMPSALSLFCDNLNSFSNATWDLSATLRSKSFWAKERAIP